MKKLYKVIIYKGSQKVYDTNLSFTLNEPNKEDIISYIKLIQPEFLLLDPTFNLNDNKIEWTYLRELKEVEL